MCQLLTFDSDLDLGRENLNFKHNKSPYLVYLSVKFDKFSIYCFFALLLTHHF